MIEPLFVHVLAIVKPNGGRVDVGVIVFVGVILGVILGETLGVGVIVLVGVGVTQFIVTDFAIMFEVFAASLTATQYVPLAAITTIPLLGDEIFCHVDELSALFSVKCVPALYSYKLDATPTKLLTEIVPLFVHELEILKFNGGKVGVGVGVIVGVVVVVGVIVGVTLTVGVGVGVGHGLTAVI